MRSHSHATVAARSGAAAASRASPAGMLPSGSVTRYPRGVFSGPVEQLARAVDGDRVEVGGHRHGLSTFGTRASGRKITR